MKIIHTADLHLSSAMDVHLDAEKSAQRRAELLKAFEDIADYAEKNGVRAILVSGDLFDEGGRATKSARSGVEKILKSHPNVGFYVLAGNHDGMDLSDLLPDMPENVHFFSDKNGFTTYDLGENITVSGAVLGDNDRASLLDKLDLPADGFHIVMFHDGFGASGKVLTPALTSKRNIDYLALGHYHSFKKGKIDDRGVWCFPGCPLGRGFDECGEKGFVLLDIGEKQLENGKKVTPEFVELPGRRLLAIEADLTNAESAREADQIIEDLLSGVDESSMITLTLKGRCAQDVRPDLRLWNERLNERFYFARIKDETRLKIDPSAYESIASLRGEFLRIVSAARLSEEDKNRVLSIGMRALSGEDPE